MRAVTGFLLLAFAASGLQAEPANGFGVTVGWVSAAQGGVSSSGTSLGVDAQFALDDHWSLNPMLMVSLETTSSSSLRLSDNLGGLQCRRWAGPVYFGPQLFFHDRLQMVGGQVVNSQYGPGVGVVLGWEGASGLSVGAQVDALEGQFLNPTDRRNAVRVHVGYRWH